MFGDKKKIWKINSIPNSNESSTGHFHEAVSSPKKRIFFCIARVFIFLEMVTLYHKWSNPKDGATWLKFFGGISGSKWKIFGEFGYWRWSFSLKMPIFLNRS